MLMDFPDFPDKSDRKVNKDSPAEMDLKVTKVPLVLLVVETSLMDPQVPQVFLDVLVNPVLSEMTVVPVPSVLQVLLVFLAALVFLDCLVWKDCLERKETRVTLDSLELLDPLVFLVSPDPLDRRENPALAEPLDRVSLVSLEKMVVLDLMELLDAKENKDCPE